MKNNEVFKQLKQFNKKEDKRLFLSMLYFDNKINLQQKNYITKNI